MNTKKVFLIGSLSSFIFILVFFNNLILNINKLYGYKDDVYLEYFIQKNNLTKMVDFKFDKIFDTQMFYPYKNTLAFGDSLLTQSLIGLPVFIVTRDVIISSHFTLLFAFFSSFLAMFFLAWHFTKSITGSILAGLIYSYNPYVMSHLQQFELINLQWIPLIFLVSAKFIEKTKWHYALLLTLLFILQIGSSFYYTFFIVITLPLYILLLIRVKKVPSKRLIHPSLVISTAIILVFAYFFLQPFTYVRKTFNIQRSLDANISFSAQPTDFFFTSGSNKLYGWMVDDPNLKPLRDSYTVIHYTEHSLFFGLTVYVLLFTTIYLLIAKKIKGDDRKITLTFLIILVLSVILAFGPYIELFGQLIPSFYLIFHKFVPFIDTLRAPSRFMALGFLALSLIIAFGWKELAGRFKKFALAGFMIVVVLINLEYHSDISDFHDFTAEINHFYSFLNSRGDIKVIVELPIANNLTIKDYSRSPLDDSIYLLYALKHNKLMINGYHGFIPPKASILGDRLSINFPTAGKLSELKNIGVDTIIVHSDEYSNSKLGYETSEKLRNLGLKQIYSSNNIYAFKN